MCSGHPIDVNLAESFHGTVIAWARRVGMFRYHDALPDPSAVDSADLVRQWRTWIHTEETIRIVMALHIHDASFASMFHHEPLLRHDPYRLPVCCSEDLLSAPSAERWLTLTKMPACKSSYFRFYAELAGILAYIHDLGGRSMEPERVAHTRNQLVFWAEEQNRKSLSPTTDPLCLFIMWHECFMSLYADFEQLERWIGRDGLPAADSVRESVLLWVASPEAKRCVCHAILVQKLVEALPTSFEPAIHVPRAIFYSAIVIYIYMKANPSSAGFAPSQGDVNIPELTLSQFDQRTLSHGHAKRLIKFSSVDLSMVCNAIDLLNRVGHWEISRRFASTLEALLDNAMVP